MHPNEVCESLKTELAQRRKTEEESLRSRSMEVITTFSGGVARDFEDIFGAVIGFTEMVIDDVPDDNPMRHRLELVLKSARRGSDLVKQILAFSRKTAHPRCSTHLWNVVAEALRLLKPYMPSTVTIATKTKTTSDMVLADPPELLQIVMNLCANAADAMKDTGGNLDLILDERDRGRAGRRRGPSPGALYGTHRKGYRNRYE